MADFTLIRSLPTPPHVRASESIFTSEATEQGLSASREMLYIGPTPATAKIAESLEVKEGSEVIARQKKMLVGETPARLATSYFRKDLFANTRITEPEFIKPSLQSAILELGYKFDRAEETLVCRLVTITEAEHLALTHNDYVVEIMRISYDVSGSPIHLLQTICVAHLHEFSIQQIDSNDEF